MNTKRQALKALKDAGYNLLRNGKKHDIYYNSDLNATIPLKRHDFNENDLKYIEKEIKDKKNENRG